MMWYNLTKQFIGLPHILGSWDKEEGIDCLALLILFREAMGEDVSDYIKGDKGFEYEGRTITRNNYMKELPTIPEMEKALKVFIRTTYKKIDKKVRGCVCFYKVKDMEVIGIYLGQGLILSSFDIYGCKVIKIRDNPITETYK